MPSSFACPACESVLKTKADVPAGKKVKCPKCETIFAAPIADVKTSPVRSSAPPRLPVPAGRAGAGNGTTVRAGNPPATPSARRQAGAGEDDGDDADERPSRKRSKKRKKKKQQNNTVLFASLGGGAGFLLLVFVITAFVAPGFLLKKAKPTVAAPQEVQAEAFGKGKDDEDLLNYVPSGCSAFLGVDIDKANEYPTSKQQWLQMLGQLQGPGMPPSLAEHINNIDRMLLTVNVEGMIAAGDKAAPEGALIARMKVPYDPEKVVQLFKELTKGDVTPEQMKNRTIYRLTGLNANPIAPFILRQAVPILIMPNDRVLILALAPEARLANLLTFTGNSTVIGPQSLAEIKSVDQTLSWMALEITPKLTELLEKLNDNQLNDFGPELKPAVPPLQKIRGLSLAEEKGTDGKLKFRLNITCASDADSQKVKSAFQAFWDKKGKGMVSGIKIAGGPLAPVLDELTATLTITAQGPQVVLGLELSEDAVQAMNAENMRNMPFGPGMGEPPPQAIPVPPPPGQQPPAVAPDPQAPAPQPPPAPPGGKQRPGGKGPGSRPPRGGQK